MMKCVAILMVGLSSSFAFAQDGEQRLQRRMINVGGVERTYFLHQPSSGTGDKMRPLVIVLHGGGGTAQIGAMMTGFNAKSDKEGFLVAYPNGSGLLGDRLLTWNAKHCCAYAMRNVVDDIGFLNNLIDSLVATERVDAKRVYMTGMSNGGMMTFRAALQLSGKIAAIAPVVGAMFGDETPPPLAMPVLMFNSRIDEIVPMDGGRGVNRIGMVVGDLAYRPTSYALDFWAKANDCKSPPSVTAGAQLTITSFSECKGRARVTLYTLDGGGHSWPGGRRPGRAGADKPVKSPNATDVMWDFFKAFHR